MGVWWDRLKEMSVNAGSAVKQRVSNTLNFGGAEQPSEIEGRPGGDLSQEELQELHVKHRLNQEAYHKNGEQCPACGNGTIERRSASETVGEANTDEISVTDEKSMEPGGVGQAVSTTGSTGKEASVEAGLSDPVYSCTQDGTLSGNACGRHFSREQVHAAERARSEVDGEAVDEELVEEVATEDEMAQIRGANGAETNAEAGAEVSAEASSESGVDAARDFEAGEVEGETVQGSGESVGESVSEASEEVAEGASEAAEEVGETVSEMSTSMN